MLHEPLPPALQVIRATQTEVLVASIGPNLATERMVPAPAATARRSALEQRTP